MAEKYEVSTTSRHSADVSEKVLKETSTTRLVLRPELIDNPHDASACVKIAFVHQRKSVNTKWEDNPAKPLSSIKAGEEVKLPLDSQTTLELFQQLTHLYAIGAQGNFRFGKTSLVVGREEEIIQADASRAKVIKLLLARGHSDDIWKALVLENPDLATQLSYARIQAERKKALQEFRPDLGKTRTENWWQEFFEKNSWIFGYGLKYQILKSIQGQPHYGGANVAGKGMEKGDFLKQTEAEVKFTVLVEIKKPNSCLLGGDTYRNGAWQLSEELTGGITQLQANCRRWELDGSQVEQNREALQEKKIYTVQPKGILVIGNTKELNKIAKRNTFELFRRNTVNPEILTFDELYERAKFIVDHTGNPA